MDIKSLIKKIPNFEELVTQIENNYNPIRKINFGLTKCYKVVFFHYQLN